MQSRRAVRGPTVRVLQSAERFPPLPFGARTTNEGHVLAPRKGDAVDPTQGKKGDSAVAPLKGKATSSLATKGKR